MRPSSLSEDNGGCMRTEPLEEFLVRYHAEKQAFGRIVAETEEKYGGAG